MTIKLLKPAQSTPVVETLPDGNYIVGRGPSSRIVLAYADVSDRHALISIRDGKASVEDLKSANGTYVDGLQIERRTVLSDESIVQIGGTVLRITADPPEKEPAAPARTDHQATLRRKIREQIQEELIVRMDLKRLTASGVDREGLERQAREKISEIVAEVIAGGKLPRSVDPERIKKEVFDEALRLGRSRICLTTPPSRKSW